MWEEIPTKAEALENAEIATAECAPASEKRNLEDGEVAPASKPSPQQKGKQAFFCRLHGTDQGHNSDGCKVINGEIKRHKKGKQSQKSSSSFTARGAQVTINKKED